MTDNSKRLAFEVGKFYIIERVYEYEVCVDSDIINKNGGYGYVFDLTSDSDKVWLLGKYFYMKKELRKLKLERIGLI